MGVAVLRSHDVLAMNHHHNHRVSFDSAFITPPPKPSRSTNNRSERSSPPSVPIRSALKSSNSPPAKQAKPGRKVRLPAEESPLTRISAVGEGLVAKLPGKNLVMGEVTILKRGDDPMAAPAPAPAAAPVLATPSPPASSPARLRKPSPPAPARKQSPPASARKQSPPASARKQLPPAPARKQSPPPPAVDLSRNEAAVAKADDFVVSSTERLGPEPEILPKQIRLTNNTKSKATLKGPVYAGSGFIASPSPSCLPFPSFFKNEAATNTLKYLLRLDLA